MTKNINVIVLATVALFLTTWRATKTYKDIFNLKRQVILLNFFNYDQ